jgi:hypothetical protein
MQTAPKVRADLSVVAQDQVAANLERYAELWVPEHKGTKPDIGFAL